MTENIQQASDTKIISNGFIMALGYLLFVSGTYITFVIVANLLNPDTYSYLAFGLSLLALMEAFPSAGFPVTHLKLLGRYSEKDCFSAYALLKLPVVFIAVILGLIFIIIDILSNDISLKTTIALVFVIGFILDNLSEPMTLTLIGINQVIKQQSIFLISYGIRFLVTICIAIITKDVFLIALAYLTQSIISLCLVIPLFNNLNIGWKKPSRELIQNYIMTSAPLIIGGIAIQLSESIDRILIGVFGYTSELTFLYIVSQLFDIVYYILNAVISVSLSTLTYRALKEKKSGQELLKKVQILGSILIIPGAIGLFEIANPVIKLLLGEEYDGIVPFLHLGIPIIILQVLIFPLHYNLISLDQQHTYAKFSVSISVLTIMLYLILIQPLFILNGFGAKGALYARIISFTIFYLGLLFYYYKKNLLKVSFEPIKILVIAIVSFIIIKILFQDNSSLGAIAIFLMGYGSLVLLGICIFYTNEVKRFIIRKNQS
ncbi:MAG: lipopolysaccharide biosynthesis protein [Candidatus Hodarchaeales archaeon]|jgi:O-antigen/teichoic acid export membrane protein